MRRAAARSSCVFLALKVLFILKVFIVIVFASLLFVDNANAVSAADVGEALTKAITSRDHAYSGTVRIVNFFNSPDILTSRGVTPLHYAIILNKDKLASYLTGKGANFNYIYSGGRNILHQMVESKLCLGHLSKGYCKEVIKKFIDGGVDCNLQDENGLYPMDYAESLDNKYMYYYLFELGCNSSKEHK